MKKIINLLLFSLVLVFGCGQNENDPVPVEELPVYPEGTIFCSGIETEIVDIINPETGKTWMDRNLGASRVARSATDEQAYGSYYQWGRFSDGHQCSDSELTSGPSTTPNPEHGFFIRGVSPPSHAFLDWIKPQNSNLWQDVDGVNNPCPEGYRLPTWAEWDEERRSWSRDNAEGAFNSPLKLTVAGRRSTISGGFGAFSPDRPRGFDSRGVFGVYWSSTPASFGDFIDNGSRVLMIGPDDFAQIGSKHRSQGSCIRCIKD